MKGQSLVKIKVAKEKIFAKKMLLIMIYQLFNSTSITIIHICAKTQTRRMETEMSVVTTKNLLSLINMVSEQKMNGTYSDHTHQQIKICWKVTVRTVW